MPFLNWEIDSNCRVHKNDRLVSENPFSTSIIKCTYVAYKSFKLYFQIDCNPNDFDICIGKIDSANSTNDSDMAYIMDQNSENGRSFYTVTITSADYSQHYFYIYFRRKNNSQEILGKMTLTNDLRGSYDVTKIGMQAFRSCYDLTSVSLPNTITDIEDMAFYGCSNIKEITLSNNLKNIGNYAFYSNYQLKYLEFPDSLKSIGYYAFQYCNNIESIKSNAITPPVCNGSEVFSRKIKENAFLIVPQSAISEYSSANEWQDFKHISSSETTHITPTSFSEKENFIFDLSGKIIGLSSDDNALNKLRPGIYIINNQKYIKY